MHVAKCRTRSADIARDAVGVCEVMDIIIQIDSGTRGGIILSKEEIKE